MTSSCFSDWMEVLVVEKPSDGSWQSEYYYSTLITLSFTLTDSATLVRVQSAPRHTDYALVVDVRMELGRAVKLAEGELWEGDSQLEHCFARSDSLFRLFLRTRQFVSVRDIYQPLDNRRLAMTGDSRPIYVDACYLAELGGRLFGEWKESFVLGAERVAIADLDPPILRPLLKAVSGYSDILVHRGNLLQLMEAGREYGVVDVLHDVEVYMLDSCVNPILKLEYAMSCKMGRLYDETRRKLGSSKEILSRVHEHLLEQGGRLTDMNPELLDALGLSGDAFCIND